MKIESYTLNSPIIIVINSLLTPETANTNPTAMVDIEYPSELQLGYELFDYTTVETKSSNKVRFKVTLKSEVLLITISTLTLSSEKEPDFYRSDRKITVLRGWCFCLYIYIMLVLRAYNLWLEMDNAEGKG